MPLTASIFSALSTSEAIGAILGTGTTCRAYPIVAPPGGVETPYVVFQTITAPPDATLGEAAASGTHLVQFSCIAGTAAAARELGDLLIAAFDNVTLAGGELGLECTPGDAFSEAADLFVRQVDVSFFVPAAS